jgi:CRISPR-associated protein (Cas_Cas02710)
MKRNFISDAIANPAKYPRSFIFVITYGFGVATTGLSTLVLDDVGTLIEAKFGRFGINKLTWRILVVFGISAIVALWLSSIPKLMKALLRKLFPVEEKVIANVTPLRQTENPTYKGLIAIMSPNTNSPAEVSIKHHWAGGNGCLKYCWLICSDKSINAVDDMVQRLQTDGIPIQKVQHSNLQPIQGDSRQVYLYYGKDYKFFNSEELHSPLTLQLNDKVADDPNHIRRLVEQIYDEAYQKELKESEVIADYTGGTKSMTAGIVLACTHPERRLQYISQISSDVIEVKIAYQLKPMDNA